MVSENRSGIVERRSKPRIRAACPAVVRGIDSVQGRFEKEGMLDNLSASGLHLLLKQRVDLGSPLFVLFRFSQVFGGPKQAPRIAVRGTVVRAEPKPDGTFGVAVKFRHYRFV